MEERKGMLSKVCAYSFSFSCCSSFFLSLISSCLFMCSLCPPLLLSPITFLKWPIFFYAGTPWCTEATSYELGRAHCTPFLAAVTSEWCLSLVAWNQPRWECLHCGIQQRWWVPPSPRRARCQPLPSTPLLWPPSEKALTKIGFLQLN